MNPFSQKTTGQKAGFTFEVWTLDLEFLSILAKLGPEPFSNDDIFKSRYRIILKFSGFVVRANHSENLENQDTGCCTDGVLELQKPFQDPFHPTA